MNLRNIRELKTFAAQRLEQSDSQKQVVWIYAGLILGLTALVTVANHLLGMQIANFGGLSNLGKKSMLSSIQSMLPFVQTILAMCLEVGYVAAMLRIARGMYTSPQTLRLGFDRFWLLMRCAVFKGLIFTGVTFVSLYAGIMVYMITPFSEAAVEIIVPLMSETSLLNTSITIDDATYMQLVQAMLPAFALFGLFWLLLGAPVYYSFRMANHVIIDRPGIGALAALRESKLMMKGNRMALLKLDLSFWWFYLAGAAAMAVCYGDMLLPMLGVTLPVSETTAYFLFYAIYLGISFAIQVFLRNRVEVTYGLAYDAVKPKETASGGVVLGNIFQM